MKIALSPFITVTQVAVFSRSNTAKIMLKPSTTFINHQNQQRKTLQQAQKNLFYDHLQCILIFWNKITLNYLNY